MQKKALETQAVARRSPRQVRSQLKVELILEAAVQLLESEGMAGLTTNAVAARAGVSIGTLYQYFADKHALLDALVGRELGAMADKVVHSLQDAPATVPGERIRKVVRAVVGAYGGRGNAHRQLMLHALTHSPGRNLSPLYERVIALFTTEGVDAPGTGARKLTPAQAFVLTHAVGGVLRMVTVSRETPPLREVEDALVQLILAYLH